MIPLCSTFLNFGVNRSEDDIIFKCAIVRRLSIRRRLSDTKSNHCFASGLFARDDASIPRRSYFRTLAAPSSLVGSSPWADLFGFDEGGADNILISDIGCIERAKMVAEEAG